MDRNRKRVEEIFARVYGAGQEARWVRLWRVFFMACAELFGYSGGNEWIVAQYLLEKPGGPPVTP